jgi:hypothetical protein
MSKGFIPGGFGEAAYALRGKLSTAIMKCPSGVYALVGSVPAELTKPDEKSLTPDARKSMTWSTEKEAIYALVGIGITHFQLADCSWYDQHPNDGKFNVKKWEE